MKTFLIVDDNPDMGNLIEMMIKNEYPKSVICKKTNGLEASEVCKKVVFDYILTDVEMPVMNGLEFLESLDELENKFDRTNIMVISAYSSEAEIKVDERTHILPKPFAAESIYDIVKLNSIELHKTAG